jgi:hypothetical protein
LITFTSEEMRSLSILEVALSNVVGAIVSSTGLLSRSL